MSDVNEIKIKKGFADGSLDLSDRGHTRAKKKDIIVWTIKDDIEVVSIEAIEKKYGNEIFVSQPSPCGDGSFWTAKIKSDAVIGHEWEYLIRWRHEDGSMKECDPLISIRPSTISGAVQFLLLLLTIVIGFFTLQFFQNKGGD